MWEINKLMHVKPQAKHLAGPNEKKKRKKSLPYPQFIQEECVCCYFILLPWFGVIGFFFPLKTNLANFHLLKIHGKYYKQENFQTIWEKITKFGGDINRETIKVRG